MSASADRRMSSLDRKEERRFLFQAISLWIIICIPTNLASLIIYLLGNDDGSGSSSRVKEEEADEGFFLTADGGEDCLFPITCLNNLTTAATRATSPPSPPSSPSSIVHNDTTEFSCYELIQDFSGVLGFVNFWLQGVFLLVIGALGLLGNAVTLRILPRMGSSHSFHKLLTTLSIVDSLVIVFFVTDLSICGQFLPAEPYWYRLAYPYLIHPLRNMTLTASIFMVVAISAERYQAICHPVRYRPSHWKYVIFVLATTLCLEVPRFFEFRLVWIEGSPFYWPSSLMENPAYIRFTSYWDDIVATGLAPFAALVFFNASIIAKIRGSRHHQYRFVGRKHTLVSNTSKRSGGGGNGEGGGGGSDRRRRGREREDVRSQQMAGAMTTVVEIEETEAAGSLFAAMSNGPRNAISTTPEATRKESFLKSISLLSRHGKKLSPSSSPLPPSSSEKDLPTTGIQMEQLWKKKPKTKLQSEASPCDEVSSQPSDSSAEKTSEKVKRPWQKQQRRFSGFLKAKMSSKKQQATSEKYRLQQPGEEEEAAAEEAGGYGGHGGDDDDGKIDFEMDRRSGEEETMMDGEDVPQTENGKNRKQPLQPTSSYSPTPPISNTNLEDNQRVFRQRRERSIALLVSIVLIFAFCHVYRLVVQVVEISLSEHVTEAHFLACQRQGRHHAPVALMIVLALSHAFIVVNSSINFAVYCLVGKEFRERLAAEVQCSASSTVDNDRT